ncbi:MAG: response regulator [Gammaproteobacteria bacterium]|nr:response regulator [Gammaproteobacteria bacterium]NNL11237.1 response regulator [Pseudomonadales bacterium]NNM10920.1 response regulator [Pseudomonadales bacterium]RZV59576.1 MAG: response regulator [Pseudomonadales bacterium]
MSVVLIVEDNELNRDMLTRRLERKDFTVFSVGDGQQALDFIADQPPDIVLLDMDLPVLDGWSTCTALRNQPATANLPVIALTAHAMSDDKQKALDAGCDDYTTKPIDFPLLLAKIEALLAGC